MPPLIPANQASGAFQRWQLEAFDRTPAPPPPGATVTTAEPAAVQTAETLEIAPGVALPTAEDVERIEQEAYRQGYAAGYEEGSARGRLEAAELHQLLTGLDEALKSLDQNVAEELQNLALEVARQVVRDTLVQRPESVLAVIREALGHLPHQHVTLRLNPADAQLSRQYIGEHFENVSHRIVEDDAIVRGGCVVEASGTQIDAQVPTRWRRVVEALNRDLARYSDE